MTNVERHAKVLDEMHASYAAKNHDYGNSFSELYQEFGLLSSVIRLSDKLGRLKTLLKAEPKVKDESIRDTLLDMANYCVMTIMEMDKEAQGQ
jgi:hypothetical protein